MVVAVVVPSCSNVVVVDGANEAVWREICGRGVHTTQSMLLCDDMQHLRDVMLRTGMRVP